MKVVVHFFCDIAGIERYAYLIVNSIEDAEKIANKLIPNFIEDYESLLYEKFIEDLGGKDEDFYTSQLYQNFVESVNIEIYPAKDTNPTLDLYMDCRE